MFFQIFLAEVLISWRLKDLPKMLSWKCLLTHHVLFSRLFVGSWFFLSLNSHQSTTPPPRFHKITCILTPDSRFESELMDWMKGHPCALPSLPSLNFLWSKDQAFWLLILHVVNRIFLSTCWACLESVPCTQSCTSLYETSKLWVNSSRANVNFNKYHFQSNIYHASQA